MPAQRVRTRAVDARPELMIADSIARVIAGWRRTRPDLDVEPIAITARLGRLHAQLGHRIEAVFRRHGLRGADFELLATLVRLDRPAVSQKRLMSELDLSAGTISLRIDRLQQHGWVRREPDPADGRGALVSLTGSGRRRFEAAAPEHLANADALLAGLSEEEREQLGMLLGKLLSTLEEPGPDDELALELGLVLESVPATLERRRAVGLAPRAGLLVRHVDSQGLAAASGIREGDLLTAAQRRPLRTRHDLRLALAHAHALTLQVVRGADELQIKLSAARRGG